jgi:hypothetical protein
MKLRPSYSKINKLPAYAFAIAFGCLTATAQAQPANAYFTGDGGKNIRLAVLEPAGKGLSKDELWMLSLVQGSITADFNKFSAMTIIDRQHVEKIMDDLAKAIKSGYYSDADIGKIGNMTNAGYVLTGVVTKTTNTYMLELAITEVGSGQRKASAAPRRVTLREMENLSAVKDAAADLLGQMGVALTAEGLAALKGATSAQIDGQTALARGITAQRQGTEVTALSYFFQAAALDPSLLDVANRTSVISANIRSGNIGADIRNDIAWRRQWVAMLAEFENFFGEVVNAADPPYTLFYSDGIEQRGGTDYRRETADLSIPVNLRANRAWLTSLERAADGVYRELNAGLNATGSKDKWGLGDWPNRGVTEANPFSSWHGKGYDITAVFELVDDRNRVIGSRAVRITPSFNLRASSGGIVNEFTKNTFGTVTFGGVSANDISDKLAIRVASVNGAPAQNARFPIIAVPGPKWEEYNIEGGDYEHLQIEGGIVKGFSKSLSDHQRERYYLVIPADIWGERITAVANSAFKDKRLARVAISSGITAIGNSAFENCQLTSVAIPNSVTSIGDRAFANNRLPNINSAFEDNQLNIPIPNSVTSIGRSAFANNQLASVTIPNSVRSIGDSAFAGNKLTNVTIPSIATSIGNSVFENNQLTNVTIPNTVKSIGNRTFANNQLTSLTIPSSVASIGNLAFDNNSYLNKITIGGNVTLQRSIVSQGDFTTTYNNNGKKAGIYHYCPSCTGDQWFDDLNQMQTVMKEDSIALAKAAMERAAIEAIEREKAEKERAERELREKEAREAWERERAEREAIEAKERAKEEWRRLTRPRIGLSGGFGLAWSGSSLNETFDLEMNNLNESAYKGNVGLSFGGGLAFKLPFTPNVAIVGETNYLYIGTSSLASKADSAKGLPEESSDYVLCHGFNSPITLQIAFANREVYLEVGGQANILSASNRDQQNSSISNYGFVAGIGAGLTNSIGLLLRFGLNSNGYYTVMFVIRTRR